MRQAVLIGANGFGRVHCADLLRLHERNQVLIAAATIRDESKAPERVAALRQAGATIFADHREMLSALAGSIDLCFIPTGIHLHETMTIDALTAGASVLVEKPAAATLGQVGRMQAAEARSEGFVAVGYQTMYAPETLVMKRAILDGTIGTLQAVKCRGLWPRPDAYYDKSPWIGRLRHQSAWVLDSPFNNAFAHQLNMIAFLAGAALGGSAELVDMQAELYRAREIETADTAMLRMSTRDGVPLYFFVSHAPENLLDPEIVVRGSRGTIRWTPGAMVIERDGGVVAQLACLTGTALRDAMLDGVLRRLDDPAEFICTLEIAAVQTLAAGAAHLSSVVHALPPEIVARVPHEGSTRMVIAGLDGVVEKCFREEKLPSEIGVPWAVPGQRLTLDAAAVAAAYPDS